jgi:alkylation response protein AidB-like acyl-CoA dehydrogenase
MDYEHNDDQRAILASVEALLAQHAGPARAIELAARGGRGGGGDYDHALDEALHAAGFVDIARGDDSGPLEAALVAEAVSRAGGVVAFPTSALVVPGVLGKARELPGPVALCDASQPGPIRFGVHARSLLSLHGDEDEARLTSLAASDVSAVRSNFGYPMGRVSIDPARGESLGPGSGARLRAWWCVALAVEAVGAMGAALDVTVAYLKQRKQFGRPIASFQAVQQRLAECAIALEGSRWLSYEAAYKDAPAELAATAASYALHAAGRLFAETHQLSGAIGFTHEHDLHVWTMRLQALRLEQGGVARHRRELAAQRWGVAT